VSNADNFNSSDGSVVLRGVVIDLTSDVGVGFVDDCCRFCEKLVTADQVKSKYKLSDDAWSQLGDNEPLLQAVDRRKERRVRDGTAAREMAQQLFIQAQPVLGTLLNDTQTPARSRIDAAKELRQVALGGETTPVTSEKFVIRIDLSAAPGGGEVIEQVVEINKPLAIGPEPDKEAEGDESL